jgi:predicted negative regulator of RcsB-dependent stress response
VALDTTDEEQIDTLKNWWKDNGTSLLTGVLVVMALLFGVRQWESSQNATAGAASDLYQQLAQMAVANVGVIVSEDDLLAAQGVYSQLKDQYASSIYTRFAALVMAKFHADKGELAEAAAELQWVLDNPKLGLMQEADEELFVVARQRLARVKLGLGDAQAALDLLRSGEAGSFVASYADTEGDALLQLGDIEGAKAAYQRALAANTDGNPAVLRLKLQNLGVSALDIP